MEKENKEAINKQKGYSQIDGYMMNYGVHGYIRYFEMINPGGGIGTNKITNSEDGTAVKATENPSEKIRDEEKFNKTDNK